MSYNPFYKNPKDYLLKTQPLKCKTEMKFMRTRLQSVHGFPQLKIKEAETIQLQQIKRESEKNKVIRLRKK